jgi:hypothetical protein
MMALSRELNFAARNLEGSARAYAAVAARQIRETSTLRTRSVAGREMALDVERRRGYTLQDFCSDTGSRS